MVAVHAPGVLLQPAAHARQLVSVFSAGMYVPDGQASQLSGVAVVFRKRPAAQVRQSPVVAEQLAQLPGHVVQTSSVPPTLQVPAEQAVQLAVPRPASHAVHAPVVASQAPGDTSHTVAHAVHTVPALVPVLYVPAAHVSQLSGVEAVLRKRPATQV